MKISQKRQKDKLENRFKLGVIPLLLLLVIFHLLSGYLVPARLWGIHHLFFFPLSFGIILALVTLLVFVPKLNGLFLRIFEKLLRYPLNLFSRVKKSKIYITISFLSLFIFYTLHTKLFLMGDGYLKLEQLLKGEVTGAGWLDDLIHLEIFRFLSSKMEWWSPALTYSSVSILCGGLFVLVVLYISDLLGKTNLEKLFLGSLILSMASLELFCGYVEAYTIFTLALVTYVFLSVLYLKSKVSLLYPFAALIFSSLLHVFGFVLVPSFLWLLWQDGKKGTKYSFKLSHLLLLFFLVLTIILRTHQVLTFTLESKFRMLIYPLFPTPTYHFSMFCWEHLVEYANQLLLISPVGIILFFFFLRDSFRSGDRIKTFLFLGSSFSLLFIFIFNSYLGTADWDLRSFPGIFFVPLGGILFISRGREWKNFKNYGLILIFVTFFHLTPWLLLHTSEKRSIEHFKFVQLRDPHPQDYTNYNVFKIARVLRQAGFPQHIETVYNEAISLYPDQTANYYNLARYYLREERYEEAISLAEKALKVNPKYLLAWVVIGRVHEQRNDLDSAAFYYKKAIPAAYQEIDFITGLCKLYLDLGRLDELEDYFRKLSMAQPELMEHHRNMGILYFIKKDYLKAKEEWENALKLVPDDSFCVNWLDNLKKMKD